jgi:hypothetical protein
MAYIGNEPTSNFASVTKDLFSGDGSTVAFTLSKVATTNGVAVFVENVRQEPTIAYAVSGTTLTFTAAPVTSSGNNIYVLHHNAVASTATHPAAQDLTAVNGTMTGTLAVTGTSTLTGAVSTGGALTVANGLTLTDGDVTVASGHGISFAATSDAGGMTSELLADYEEGTWTIAMTAATSGTITLNGSFNTGYYTKIGDTVTAYGHPKISSVSSPNGNTLLSLPFTSKNEDQSTAVGAMLEAGVTYQSNQTGGFLVLNAINTATMTILYNTDGDFFGLQAQSGGLGANDQLRFSITYKVE